MKLNTIIFFTAAILLGLSSCQKVLDKKDLGSLDGGLIFNDSTLAFFNLSFVYDQNLPSWYGNTGGAISGNGTFSDEAQGTQLFFSGQVISTTVADFGTGLSNTNNWGKIRKINEFIRDVKNGSMPEATKNRMLAEAMFFRAFRYFDLVRLYGGVPIVLEPMDPIGEANKEGNMLPREPTSACIQQIIADLDFGIQNLPGKWPSTNDWGRMTKGAAAAFKGRVLLTYASPQFNPNDLQERWQVAYDANVKAKELLDIYGFGLNSSYANLWFQEVNNPEAVIITGYNTKSGDNSRKSNTYDLQTRPTYLSSGNGGSNAPTWDFVKDYPMKDGKKPGLSTTYPYDEQHYYKNRDPRFDNTIAYNGCTWSILGDATYRLWTYIGYKIDDKGVVTYVTTEPNGSNTGFYLRKAISPTATRDALPYSGTDWIELRYAEVLLNLAESACGINKTTQNQEAYQGLIALRKRAGIDAGADGMYGLQQGLGRSALFDAILYERKIELAFEGKRFWDLRRWKKFETELNGKKRTGLRMRLKIGAGIPTSDQLENTRNTLNLDDIYTNYMELETQVKDGANINWKPEYYFFAIPDGALNNNTKLKQNNTWGGPFNPLN
ncbi:MAG: RagB/SusD family nutrient uptake outer membrane protein [Candidatus Pedobacter colombiensis]|uniref:RagB/SusD family nutrient uptake outer membrane protein n=1 Tax=Candidatus Pedobacter colombiensis TaxID=3121371 RepID=A0AAJ5W5X6_9SPHI|nr:RagB/SusD family nutrient uptake outer membrane protein [Pedobacter sp.]WEK17713.1 MAG: RagB/SusD family nutrient uptake outer membrane protein [Pedobacter sp.]